MEALFDPSVLAGLATLIVLEVVLGIDNLVFIAILTDKLPPHQRDKARIYGLTLALVMRLGLLASIAWIVGLTAPVFSLLGKAFSWRDIILLGGGLFLLVKATMEIHGRLEGGNGHESGTVVHATFGVVIAQIIALDAVFSLDSIITAVGMVDELWVMVVAVIVAMVIMLAASKPLTLFVNRHPTVIILCLSFLLLIGCSLVAESFGFHIPKAYLYAAIGFSLLIEVFNQMRTRNYQKQYLRMPLRQRTVDSIYRLLTPTADQRKDEDAPDQAAVQPSIALSTDAFHPAEKTMIRGVIELAEKPVRAIMTPRSEIDWLDARAPAPISRDRLIASGRTRMVLCDGGLDALLGIIETRDALPALLAADVPDLSALAKRPLIVPDELSVLRLMDLMRETGERFAVVSDSHGNIDGVVTPTDIFAAIAGDIADDESDLNVQAVDDDTIEVDARLHVQALRESLGLPGSPTPNRYTTLAGYLLMHAGRMPPPQSTLEIDGLEFQIVEASAFRIERVRVRKLQAGGPTHQTG